MNHTTYHHQTHPYPLPHPPPFRLCPPPFHLCPPLLRLCPPTASSTPTTAATTVSMVEDQTFANSDSGMPSTTKARSLGDFDTMRDVSDEDEGDI